MAFAAASLSDRGGREINDDTVRIEESPFGLRVYVGDGLGGYAGGRQASERAGNALFAAAQAGTLLGDGRLPEAVEQAHQAVLTLQKETKGNMKTTLVFLTLEGMQARWAHVGDSRLYHFRDGKLVRQTVDHSVSQMAVLLGDITQDQVRFHEDRNRVLRALGAGSAKPEVSPVLELRPGRDVFLLCTDGFWEYVLEPEMEKTLIASSDPEQWLKAMEKVLLGRVTGDNDNYTAAAVFC